LQQEFWLPKVWMTSSNHVGMQDQADTLLQPVLKQYEEKETQLRLDAFWTVTHRFAKIRSKRLQAAISTSLGRDLPQEMLMRPEETAAHVDAPNTRASARSTKKKTADSATAAAAKQPKQTGTGAAGARDATIAQRHQQDQEQGTSGSSEEEEDEYPADAVRHDLPAGDPDDFGGLDVGMDPYRSQFFY
jgi:DNA excision repair protein ERCC-5